MFKNLKRLVYGVGLVQIGYAGYNGYDYLYRYGLHQNVNLKSQYQSEYALVTGASQGLGLGYAEELAKRGYNVILVSRTQSALENVASQLQAKYSNVSIQYRTFDLENQDPAAFDSFFSKLKEDYGDKIGIFINNAATFEADYLQNLTSQKIKSVVDTNIIGATFFIQQQLKYALENSKNKQQKTLLINIGSQKATRGGTEKSTIYYSTKQYMNHFTQCLREQYKSIDNNIQIINNSPGYMDTPMLWSFYPNFLNTLGSKYLDTPQNVAKQALDQVDLNPPVINGTEKQAFGNIILALENKYNNLVSLLLD